MSRGLTELDMSWALLQRLPERLRGRILFDWGTGCWLWAGSDSGSPRTGKTGRSYGRVRWQGCTRAVHRLVYQLLVGRIPVRRQLDHTCRQRRCCSPLHLEPVTHRINTVRRDRARRLQMICEAEREEAA